jgi:uncharacterized repeat protein (TIGR01451 family)
MMKKILVMASMMMLGAMSMQAAGTAAGTQIDNQATLSYYVNNVAQDEKTSNTDSFVVDNKIDLTVAHQDANIKEVTPGTTAQVLTFLVTNTGNKTQDYSLTSTPNDGNPYGENDTFDATNVHVYVESGAHPGYQAGEDTATYIDELAPDDDKTVYIVADIPSSQVDGDVAEYTLTAQVAEGGTANTQGADITSDNRNDADDATTEQIVFADGDGAGATDSEKDGKYADNSAYKVKSAKLDVVKLSCVITDGVTADDTKAKRIPGATIAYVFDVHNTGSENADNVTIKDDLAAQLDETNVVVHALESNTGNTACDCQNGSGNHTTGTNSTPANSQANHDVEVNMGTVNAGNHSCLEIRVPIK